MAVRASRPIASQDYRAFAAAVIEATRYLALEPEAYCFPLIGGGVNTWAEVED